MRKLKNWLIPLLTCLIVAGAALAPYHLSALRDRQLSGAVHTETLSGDNNFSLWAPTMEERIALLSEYERGRENISSVYQVLERDGLRRAEELALEQLTQLAEEYGISDLVPEQLSYSYGEQLYLWTPENLGGASFYRLNLEDTGRGWNVSLALDVESGTVLRLDLSWYGLEWFPPEEVGRQFLERLGVDYTIYGAGAYEALFILTATGSAYLVSTHEGYVYIALTDSPEERYTGQNVTERFDSAQVGP